MIGLIAKFFLGGGFNSLTDQLSKAYEAKLKAENDEQRIQAETFINQLEAQRSILMAEQKRWFTAWIRPLLALPVVIYVWKIIVWDTVLQLGVTPNPGDIVQWIVVTITGAYFLTRPFERK